MKVFESDIPRRVLVAAPLILLLPVANAIARLFGASDPWVTTITASGQIVCASVVAWWAIGVIYTYDRKDDHK
ncbi:MAG: hypothetical protein ABWX96_21365 [Propionibacteriaceae bacterium]